MDHYSNNQSAHYAAATATPSSSRVRTVQLSHLGLRRRARESARQADPSVPAGRTSRAAAETGRNVALADADASEHALLNDPGIDPSVFTRIDGRRLTRVILRSLFDSLRSDVEVFDDFLEVLSLALYGPSDL